MLVGHNIRRFRKEAGLSLSELAEKANISKGYLSALENEDEDAETERRPSGQSLYKIAEALGITVADLIGEPTHDTQQPQIPDSLREFAQREKLPKMDVAMLARIEFRGEQPKTPDAWAYLYTSIKYSTAQ